MGKGSAQRLMAATGQGLPTSRRGGALAVQDRVLRNRMEGWRLGALAGASG
jgi:hypothetical protein